MSKFKKLTDFLKSLKCRLILLCILIGIVPSVLLRAGMLGSYENRAVSIRTSEILSQAKILANQIVSNDYLNNAESESAINVQLEQLSTIYDGRVMIIDEEFHIIKDTYNLDTGKTIISEEVIKSIQGEEISKYDSQNRYIEMTIPLVHVDPETENKRTIGVIMVSVSTDSINLNLEYLARNTLVMELIAIVAIIFAGTFIAIHLVAPFHAMAKSIEEIQTGYGDDALKIDAYTETRQICEKFNKMLGRMKVLDDSRQEFVSNVSHELKTPLTVILSSSDLLAQEESPTKRAQYLDNIRAESQRMRRLVEGMLTLARGDSGRAKTPMEPVALSELANETAMSFEPVAFEAGHPLEYELAENLTVRGRADELRQVLAILLDNAVKYAPAGAPVRLTLRESGRDAALEVENPGDPIPPEQLAHLFDRFYRADASRSDHEGFGLGLSIAQSIVTAHRGTIRCRSDAQGTCFTVTLPLQK